MKVFLFLFIFPVISFASIPDVNEIQSSLWWNSTKEAQIKFYEENDKLFGKIVWLSEEDMHKIDSKNPDLNLRGQRLFGMTVVKDFVKTEDGFANGTIYDPNSGKTYQAKMKVDSKKPNEITLRGFIGISLFGRNETLSKVR